MSTSAERRAAGQTPAQGFGTAQGRHPLLTARCARLPTRALPYLDDRPLVWPDPSAGHAANPSGHPNRNTASGDLLLTTNSDRHWRLSTVSGGPYGIDNSAPPFGPADSAGQTSWPPHKAPERSIWALSATTPRNSYQCRLGSDLSSANP